MAKFRSSFVSELDGLKEFISIILAKNADGTVSRSDIVLLFSRLESFISLFRNCDFSDLICK